MSTSRGQPDEGAMLHPELRAEGDPDAIIRGGRRLAHLIRRHGSNSLAGVA